MDATLSANTAVDSAASKADAGRPAGVRVRTDFHIWGTYILLVLFAVVELFSASIQEVHHDAIVQPLIRHSTFLVAGLACMLVLQHIHYSHIYKLIPLFVAGCLAMMILVHVNGTRINGAARAIEVLGIMILPADILKLAVALGLAWILTRFRDAAKSDISTTGLIVALVFLGGCELLLFEHGLSNTLIVGAIGISMMLIGGISTKKILIMFAAIAVAGTCALSYKMMSKADDATVARLENIARLNGEDPAALRAEGRGRGSVWRGRLADHFRPDKSKEPFSSEHAQEQLSYIAQAHGGLTGVGVGQSRENARLPLAYSDYIYAIIIEELGAVTGIFLLGVYLWILGRAATLTTRFKQTLPAVLVMGCAFTIVFQALYHMAIVTGVFPVSGQPLPLISRGGVSVLATSIAFGVMLSCARHAARNNDTKAQEKQEQKMLPDDAVSQNPSML